jgi:hypothetical protein
MVKRIRTIQPDKPPDEIKSEGFLRVDNRLIRLYGTSSAMFMSNLIDKYLYFKKHKQDMDGWFFLTHEDQIKQTGLTEYMIVKCKREAILNKWITTKLIGSKDYVTREYYELNLEHPDIQIAIEFSRGSPQRIRREVPHENDGFLNKTKNKTKESSSSSEEDFEVEEDSFSKEKEIVSLPLFEKFWNMYPKKIHKGKVQSLWNELEIETNPPLWKEIYRALLLQKKSGQWEDPQYISLPYNWLEQSRWKDDPKEMKSFPKKDKEIEPKCLFGFVFGNFKQGRHGCMECEDKEERIHRRCVIKTQEKK